MTMAEHTIEIEAGTLEEARQKLKARIPKGLDLLSERVISHGKPRTVTGVAETIAAALVKAQGNLPTGSVVLKKEERAAPRRAVLTVEAFDEDAARVQIVRKVGNPPNALIESVRLVVPAKKGFLGIGKKPGRYEAKVRYQAVLEITYKTPAKLVAEIGKFTRSARETQMLGDAERNNNPVDILCEQCGRRCKALGRPVASGTVMVMTPDIAIIASRYCDRCKLVVCGGCVGVAGHETGLRLAGRACPRCKEETTYAAATHLRQTHTKLA